MSNNIVLNFASNMNYGNLGDLLSRYVVEKNSHKNIVKYDKNMHNTTHLNAIGSIFNRKELCSPCIIWGSGFLSPSSPWKLNFDKIKYYLINHKLSTPTIIAVRGIHTKNILLQNGFQCPNNFGDPGLIMPHIYFPSIKKNIN